MLFYIIILDQGPLLSLELTVWVDQMADKGQGADCLPSVSIRVTDMQDRVSGLHMGGRDLA